MTIENDLAAVARKMIESHDEWDSLHTLMLICRDGDGICPKVMAGIDPAFPPEMYPVMIEAFAEDSADKGDPPYALLLQVEAFGAKAPPADAPAWQQMQFESDRENRTIHQRADAEEAAWAWVADIRGNLWSAKKTRGEDGIEECFYEPGSPSYSGRFVKAMFDSLYIYGSEFGGARGHDAEAGQA